MIVPTHVALLATKGELYESSCLGNFTTIPYTQRCPLPGVGVELVSMYQQMYNVNVSVVHQENVDSNREISETLIQTNTDLAFHWHTITSGRIDSGMRFSAQVQPFAFSYYTPYANEVGLTVTVRSQFSVSNFALYAATLILLLALVRMRNVRWQFIDLIAVLTNQSLPNYKMNVNFVFAFIAVFFLNSNIQSVFINTSISVSKGRFSSFNDVLDCFAVHECFLVADGYDSSSVDFTQHSLRKRHPGSSLLLFLAEGIEVRHLNTKTLPQFSNLIPFRAVSSFKYGFYLESKPHLFPRYRVIDSDSIVNWKAFIVNPSWSGAQLFNVFLYTMHETGLVQKTVAKYMGTVWPTDRSSIAQKVSELVGLNRMAAGLAGGWTLAILSFCCEKKTTFHHQLNF